MQSGENESKHKVGGGEYKVEELCNNCGNKSEWLETFLEVRQKNILELYYLTLSVQKYVFESSNLLDWKVLRKVKKNY